MKVLTPKLVKNPGNSWIFCLLAMCKRNHSEVDVSTWVCSASRLSDAFPIWNGASPMSKSFSVLQGGAASTLQKRASTVTLLFGWLLVFACSESETLSVSSNDESVSNSYYSSNKKPINSMGKVLKPHPTRYRLMKVNKHFF